MQSVQPIRTDSETDGDARQFLTFHLAGQEYGLDILAVREIRGWSGVTPLPNVPHYVRGVINLRGAIVPIIDLRGRFGLETAEYGPATVVIVLRVNDGGHGTLSEFGIVVDAVAEVYTIDTDSIRSAPDFGNQIDRNFVHGLATLEDHIIILLDIDRVLNHDTQDRIARQSKNHDRSPTS